MNNWIKRNGGHLIVAAIFLVLTYAYFLNPIMQGKILYQGDVLQAKAMQKEFCLLQFTITINVLIPKIRRITLN